MSVTKIQDAKVLKKKGKLIDIFVVPLDISVIFNIQSQLL